MSDDDEDDDDDDQELGPAYCATDVGVQDRYDMVGFGPLLPTESERSLMETVRQGLKIELKQVPYTKYMSMM